MIIAFAGPMGSGKTTAAKMLPGFNLVSFAKPLKDAAKILFDFTDEQLYTFEGKETVDPRWGITPREALQWLGTDVFREKFPGFWARLMKARIDRMLQTNKNWNIAIDDCRFFDEAEVIRRLGGHVIHITGRAATSEHSGHKSEKSIETRLGDLVIDNSGSLEDLKRKLTRMMNPTKF